MDLQRSVGVMRLNAAHPDLAALHILDEPQFQLFVSESKVLIIMRGVSGCGKSTIVKRLMEKFSMDKVCSADSFFQRYGEYQFDETKLKEAHQFCQDKAQQYCNEGHSMVIIDNTCIRRWESHFYVDLAAKTGYVVIFLTPEGHFALSAEVLAERNKHGVPVEKVQEKLKAYESIVPRYYGWFFTASIGAKLEQLAKNAFTQCTRDVPRAFLKGVDISTYGPPYSRAKHMTAYYFGRDVVKPPKEKADLLTRATGLTDSLTITHLVFTKRSISARVALNSERVRFFYDNDAGNEVALGFGCRAHVTILLREGEKSSVSGPDMVLSRQLERNAESCEASGGLKYYANAEVAVLQLKSEVQASVMFSGGY